MNDSLNYRGLVFIDLATSGLGMNCDIIQIGAVAAKTGCEFNVRVEFDEDSAADKKVLLDSGYDSKLWAKEAVSKIKALRLFSDFLSENASLERMSKNGSTYKLAAVAGYNVLAFDSCILKRAYSDLNLFLPVDYRMYDVMQLAMWRLPNLRSYSLSNVCEHLGVKNEGVDALSKARACFEIAKNITGRAFKFQNFKWAD